MSSCWKCGRELPTGEVECEDGCENPSNSPAYRELMGLADQPPKLMKFADMAQEPNMDLQLTIVLSPDKSKIADATALAEFEAAFGRFVKSITDGFEASGLNQFVKRVK